MRIQFEPVLCGWLQTQKVYSCNKNKTTQQYKTPIKNMALPYDTVAFNGINSDTLNKKLSLIKLYGFSLFDRVNIINPKGEVISGYSFIKAKRKNIISVITDNEFDQLGHVSMNENYRGFFPGAWCSVVNNTSIKETLLSGFKEPYLPFYKTLEDGHYKMVATQAYNSLIKYIKQNKPYIKKLNVNAITKKSWDYHKKLGFISSKKDFNTLSLMNKLSKPIDTRY